MIVWTLIGAIITEGCSVFISAEGLIKQLRFPYTLLSCSVIWRNLLAFFHNLLIFCVVMIYARVPITWATFLAVPAMVLIFVNGIWVVTLLGLFCSRFRDIQQVIGSLLQVLMFVTPIFWAPNQLGPRFSKFVDYNVLYHFVDILRSPLLGRPPATLSWGVAVAVTVVGWGTTLFLFSRFRRRIPYWL